MLQKLEKKLRNREREMVKNISPAKRWEVEIPLKKKLKEMNKEKKIDWILFLR